MIRYENEITANDYLRLREDAGWRKLCREQAENAVSSSYYTVCCFDGDTAIGMARLLWCGDQWAYIADVVVDHRYRGQGIGGTLVTMCRDHLKETIGEGFAVRLFLLAAKGRESFYEQFGFCARPNENAGAAMEQWIVR